VVKNMGRFSLALHIFCIGDNHVIDFSRKSETTESRLWAMHFLLVPSCHGIIGASVHLLRESMHAWLICMADQWAWSPLAVRAAPVAGGGELFVILGVPRTIPGVVHKESLLRLFGSIYSRVPGIDSLILPFHRLP
jgi:hypothetical protein